MINHEVIDTPSISHDLYLTLPVLFPSMEKLFSSYNYNLNVDIFVLLHAT